jgi:hypothetical protein
LTLADQDERSVCAAFQPDGRRIATGGSDGRVHLWDAATGKKTATFPGHKGAVHTLAFAPDGATLVTTDGTTLEWWQVATGKKMRTHQAKPAHWFGAARFSPDGQLLFVGDNCAKLQKDRPTVVALDAATGEERSRRAVAETIVSLTVAPDGRLVVLGLTAGAAAARFEAMEVASGNSLGRLQIKEQRKRAGDSGQVVLFPDGKTVLFGGDDRLLLGNVFTGAVRASVPVTQNWACWLGLSADGRVLASASEDETVLVWDAARLTAAPPAKALTAAEAQQCWEELAAKDAGRAWRCVDRLCGDAARAVALIKERLRPVPHVDEAALKQLIADLDDPRFVVRNKAMQALQHLGDVAALPLRQKLAGPLGLESQRRVKQLLEKIDPEQSGEVFRLGRAVAVLEHVNTPAARQLLQALADGAPQGRLTVEARSALKRMQ